MYRGLVVDDAAIMRIRIREMLSSDFNVVGEASTGKEAIDEYNRLKPDFVTLDITMPQLNGMEALKSILSKDPDAKVVIVSAVGQKQMVYDALELGAKDFVVKPFETERVIKAVKRLFKMV